MHEVRDTDRKPPKKPLIFYYVVAMVVLLLLNALFFPSVLSTRVIEVPYSTFLNMVDDGQVRQVALEESSGQLVFTAEVPESEELRLEEGGRGLRAGGYRFRPGQDGHRGIQDRYLAG